MGFFKKVLGVAAKVAPVAIGFALGGPVGAAAGGAIGSAARGGDLTQIAQGAAYGYGAGSVASAGANALAASGSNLAPGAAGPVTSGIGGSASVVGNSLVPGASSLLSTGSPSALISGAASNPLSLLLQGANLAGNIYGANQGVKAATNAAELQSESVDKALAAQKEATTQIRNDLGPYRAIGTEAAPKLTAMVNDPQAKLNFIQNNPFYAALAEDAKNKLFANQAARGKLGSGGTAEALQNSLLLLGDQLVNNNISQNQNLVNLGENAAAGTGQITQGGTNNITNLLTDQGNAQAAGVIGGYNAKTGAINNALGTATSLYGIDKGIRI